MDTTSLELLFSALVLLIILSAFFSSSETAMMSLNRYRLKHLSKQNHPGAMRASKLLERPDRLIGLILFGNNLVNLAAAAIATLIAVHLWGESYGPLISTLLLTVIILLFAEVTPKTIAALHPEKIAFPATLILKPLMWLLYPFVWLINHAASALLRPLGINPEANAKDSLSADELRAVVDTTDHDIPDKNQGMLLNILDLADVSVDDIMVPRKEILGIDLEDSDEKIVDCLLSSDYTRLPVFRRDINNIEGMFHLRKSAQTFSDGAFNRETMVELLQEVYFIPDNTPLHTQLQNFQKDKQRIAVVVDEYGEVMGMITLEDILEEIVGEFTSNIADDIEEILPQKDGSYIIDGTADIRDINKVLGWKLPTEGRRTLNGLLLEHLESFPSGLASVQINNYRLEIMEISDNKIQAVRARLFQKDAKQ
ncbi:MAG: HlyC/CorC family transporter [Pseudomonadales bacterium]